MTMSCESLSTVFRFFSSTPFKGGIYGQGRAGQHFPECVAEGFLF